MMILLLLLPYCLNLVDGKHFNGGTILWEPVYPYTNSSTVLITITQSYSWSYPTISCATNVPISTSRRSSANANLTCITDCSTDGGYSTKPVNILADCVSVSSSLGMMSSQRSVNVSLSAGAHFYVSYMGSAWVTMNSPPKSNLQWSITSLIDIRFRDDGFINTPPVASIVSPQYAIVNTTTQIEIPVSDVNTGDDIRCRWSTYTPGVNRRRRSVEDMAGDYELTVSRKIVHTRDKRASCYSSGCRNQCGRSCSCSCSSCAGTTCNSDQCYTNPSCPVVGTTAIVTTTTETAGILASTLPYATRQAIDECGGICYPSSMPNGTKLANCTLTFIGLVPDTWYAVAIQVEDFMNTTSTTPMSSVPVQFLIYVMPQPDCPVPPVIVPVTDCGEILIGVSKSFNIYVSNQCDPNDIGIADLVVISEISGMVASSLTTTSNASLTYKTFTWTPPHMHAILLVERYTALCRQTFILSIKS